MSSMQGEAWREVCPGDATETNFRAFFEAVTDLLLVGDLDGRIVYANPAVTAKLGYTPEQLTAMHMLDLHPPFVRTEAEQVIGKMFCGEADYCPLPLQAASGELVPVETRVWFGEWNGERCMFGISKDLTREQEALQRFDRLFRSNPLPMAVTDVESGQFFEVNDAFSRTLGYSRSEVLGSNSRELGLFPDAETRAAVGTELMEHGSIAGIDLQVRRKDGELLDALFSGEMVHSQGRTYGLTVMVDMTERIRTQRELQRSEGLLNGLAKATQRLLAERELTEAEIVDSLAILGRAVGADRVYIFEHEDGEEGTRGYCSQRFEWSADGTEPQIDNPDLQHAPWEDVAPRWYDTFIAGGVIAGHVADFPPEERAVLEPQDVLSVLVLPIRLRGRLWGFIGFDACTAPRVWDESEQVLLEAAANGFGTAIERERLQRETAAAAAFNGDRAEASEARFRMIFEQAPVGIVRVDGATRRIVEANPALCAIAGRDEQSLLGVVIDTMIFPGESLSHHDLDRLMAGEVDALSVEQRWLRPDAGEVIVSVTAVAQKGSGATPEHLVGIVEDITERRRAESATVEAQMSMIYALAKLAESRDDDTGKHLERVQHLCRTLAEEVRDATGTVDDEFVSLLFNAAPLHDVGKVGVPDAVLLKPGPLTPEEFEQAKVHTVVGADTLAAVRERYPLNDFVSMGIDVARYHHERWDGKGYPECLTGEAIPMAARIMAVADVYEALRSPRVYKDAIPHDDAVTAIVEGSGTQFDPIVIEAFIRVADVFEKIWSAGQA